MLPAGFVVLDFLSFCFICLYGFVVIVVFFIICVVRDEDTSAMLELFCVEEYDTSNFCADVGKALLTYC